MSLSTDNFILALRRFIARRGRTSIIYSDNGTNFIGMDNSLKTINLRRLETSFTPITWKFIPPAAPWWGGFWERLIELDGESLITNEDEVPDTPGDPETQDVPESNTVTTRAGRQARPPSRYRP
ncbi:hypothetical protein AVEN_235374-1 [Araneus ventricosus]|uniref:Integrase catalytic domain-containing protein n=1 Tax=Araneus ventricosus TaxID=182803 RepID=A0A4Y2A4X6_ARAVE|nr:hypothetical protein AVEN_235374-1 [Araneus ventricosus]